MLSAVPYLNHGFFSRQGGVSKGYFGNLNCKSHKNDNVAHTQENRRRITQHLGGTCWVGLTQKHTNKAVFVDKSLSNESPKTDVASADALVTTVPGLILSIITADCVPILLCDANKPLIGAIHAGWRGMFKGIIENTVGLMRDKGATDLRAAIGPCIHQLSYEVGPEFYEYFHHHSRLSETAHFDDFFQQSPLKEEHYLFDLPGLVRHTLHQQDVVNIDELSHNTFTNEELFFSYRRKTLRGELDTGCQASCILIKTR